MSVYERLQLAVHWLTDTPIRETDVKSPLFGSIKAGYDWRKQVYLYTFHEITGYAVNTFVSLYKSFHNSRYLDYARHAAAYLLSCQCCKKGVYELGAFFHSVLPNGEPVMRYYTFDTAVIMHGLLSLYEVTKNTSLFDAAYLAGNWLVNRAQFPDGAFRACYEPSRGWVNENPTEFSSDRACLHAKHAIPLLKLYQLTGESRFRDAAEAVCNWVISLQDATGAFWANEKRLYVNTHAHCYAVEGLLYAGWTLETNKFLTVSQKAAQWLADVQRKDGSLYRAYYDRRSIKALLRRAIPVKTVDAVAQSIRLWMLLQDRFPSFEKHIESALPYLLKHQFTHSTDNNMVGGFLYQSCNIASILLPHPIMYTWATQFAIQALLWKLVGARLEDLF